MRVPQFNMQIFQERRNRLAPQLKGSTLILSAHPEFIRNGDVHHAYRPDSNLFYLTGFEEPNAVFVFRPGQHPETILFVQPKDASKETWTGFRYGPDLARQQYLMSATHTIDQLESELPRLIKDSEKIFYSQYSHREMDVCVNRALEQVALARSRTNKGNITIEDSRPLIGEMRITKSTYEVEQLKKAGDITSAAHVAVMKATHPGVNERELHGIFIQEIMKQGCAREGYGSIVATGANATTLHYVFNDQSCRDGEMLLVDAGGEYNYYTADITRAFPVNGKFTPPQKRVYQKMLDLQKHLVASVKPGQTREGLQKEAISGITDILVEEKILKGRKSELIEKKEYFKYYPHGVGHWLGMDVHDAGLTEIHNEPRPFTQGIVLTIEPGLYIPQDAQEAPAELRGLGIRIEDNILVTSQGHENLTVNCPKEISELEELIGKGC